VNGRGKALLFREVGGNSGKDVSNTFWPIYHWKGTTVPNV